MSATKKLLTSRKKEIQKLLEPLRALEQELKEIETALDALEGPKCSGCNGGCDICRTGWYYR